MNAAAPKGLIVRTDAQRQTVTELCAATRYVSSLLGELADDFGDAYSNWDHAARIGEEPPAQLELCRLSDLCHELDKALLTWRNSQ